MIDGFPLAVIAILSFISVWFLGVVAFITTPWLLWVSFSQLAALGGLAKGDPKAGRRILRSTASRVVVLSLTLAVVIYHGGWSRTGVWLAGFLLSATVVLLCGLRLDTVRRTQEQPLGPWPHLATGAAVGAGVVFVITVMGLSMGR